MNQLAGAGSYAFVNPGIGKIGSDEIAVGLIYKPGKVGLAGGAAILDAASTRSFWTPKTGRHWPRPFWIKHPTNC
ncbi:hypothetical protein [Methylomonas koyamae]|uniref:hypothetical protein n=1 Tax=Methylomonas koyamae TaxID=702114 RepID=UPI002110C6FA|nr:hypothetical protein [Methylomonas koyamae]